MKFLKNLFIVIAVLAIILVAVGFFLPKTAHVERSIKIDASRDAVFQEVNSFEEFNSWSPWFERDPEANYEFSGSESGVGAMMSWHSSEVGNGSQEIVKSNYPSRVEIEMLFEGESKPAYSIFALEELGPRETELTWSFDADFGNNIVGRYFGVAMDRMLGPDYEKGLQALKQKIEN